MTTNLQTYNNYKPSGVEWLGDIPEHWEMKKLKFLGSIYPGLSGKKGDDFSKEYSNGIKSFIPFTNIFNNLKISDNHFQYVKVDKNENQNRVLKNDILFLMSSETLDDIAKCSIYLGNEKELYLNSFCKGFRISKSNVNPEYVNYLFLSTTYRNYFTLVGRGFTRINLNQEYINDAYTLLPSLQEQTAIAKFLDDKTAKIDQAITIKKNQIELLKERKHSLINKAVTKGINPNAKLKSSDVEWIGEIPEHWQVKRLKYVFQILKRISGELGHSVLSITQKGIKVKDTESGTGQLSMDYSKYQFVYKGDFAMNHMDLLTGYVDISKYDGVISPDYRVFDLIEPNSSKEYMLLLLQLCYSNKVFYAHGQGVSMLGRWRFPSENFNIFPFPVPPKSEQIEIADFIAKTNKKIAKAISLKEKEIEKLKEYKASLINSAVTGKVKVF